MIEEEDLTAGTLKRNIHTCVIPLARWLIPLEGNKLRNRSPEDDALATGSFEITQRLFAVQETENQGRPLTLDSIIMAV